jgi:hypothetical protein
MVINKLRIGNKTLKISDEIKKVNSNKIIGIISAKVRSFSKSGAYIPLSQEYKNHNVYVIVLGGKK